MRITLFVLSVLVAQPSIAQVYFPPAGGGGGGALVTQTWDDSGTTFVGTSVDITDTASAADSLISRWRVNGSNKMELRKDGRVVLTGALVTAELGLNVFPVNIAYLSQMDVGGWWQANTGASGGVSLGNGHKVCWDPGDDRNTPGSGCNGAAKLGVGVASSGVTVENGLQWLTGTRPTCDADHRGMVWYVAGAGGVADTFAVCRKDAGDAYAWAALF